MRERDLKSLEFDKVLAIVAGFAASESGRQATLAIRPSTNPADARDRSRASAEMLELRGHSGAVPIAAFADQREFILAASRIGAILDGVSLVFVRDFVVASRTASAFLRSRVERYPHVSAITANLLAPRELADALMKALGDSGALLDDASPELKRIRVRLRDERADLESRLLRALAVSGMEPFVSDHIVTVRNRRFVLPLKPNYTERLEGIVQDRSVSGETLFVEPMWAVELNNRLMMLEREGEAEETRILAGLTAMVGGYATELTMTFEAMVALDAVNARAIFAERYACIEPEISDDGLDLRAARHPLLISAGRSVVPIDIKVGAGQRGIVISGPNTGGKTVALKTIGLLCAMAAAGIPVPAGAGSSAMVFASIFADIGDEQSIEANLSSFSGHIANLSDILAKLAEPALVILDEPGAGTDPAEGAALAIGLMNHLSARRCVLAIATHSTAVKLHAYSRANFEAAAVDFDAENLTPRYQLKPHTIGQSYGLAVARRLGLPAEVIDAAQLAMGTGSAELEQSLERLERERARLASLVEKARERERAAAEAHREAEARLETAREKYDRDRARLRADVAELIAQLKRDGEAVIADIKSRSKSRTELSNFASRATSKLDTTIPASVAETPADDSPLKVGDDVVVGDIRGELTVLEPARAVITRGSLRIEVAPDRIRRSTQPLPRARTQRSEGFAVSTSADESIGEINLIGMRTADALRKLEDYLDQAYLTNRNEVRVIHGIGSGALRKAVAEYLSESPYCAAFHPAEPHQGGVGATIVQLNT